MSLSETLCHQLFPLGTGTAILTAALLAGTQMFRNTGIDVGLEPGTYVLIEMLDEPGMALLARLDEFMAGYAELPSGGWPELVGTGPTESLLELVEQHEPGFRSICAEGGISVHEMPEIAIRAAAMIICRARDVLNPEMGKMIVAQGLVYACKHTPPALNEP
jgi:hypothetical protein